MNFCSHPIWKLVNHHGKQHHHQTSSSMYERGAKESTECSCPAKWTPRQSRQQQICLTAVQSSTNDHMNITVTSNYKKVADICLLFQRTKYFITIPTTHLDRFNVPSVIALLLPQPLKSLPFACLLLITLI